MYSFIRRLNSLITYINILVCMFYIVKFVIPLAFFFFFKLIRSGSKDKKKKKRANTLFFSLPKKDFKILGQ